LTVAPLVALKFIYLLIFAISHQFVIIRDVPSHQLVSFPQRFKSHDKWTVSNSCLSWLWRAVILSQLPHRDITSIGLFSSGD
jgi:hypothetical protein